MARTTLSRNAGSIVKMAELAVAAPQVVAMRTAQMLAAGANPSVRDRTEFSGMCTEKVQAMCESMAAMATQLVRTNQEYARTAVAQWVRMWTNPWWLTAYRPATQAMASLARPAAALIAGPTRAQKQRAVSKLVEQGLKPVHKRATANAKRLRGVKKAAAKARKSRGVKKHSR